MTVAMAARLPDPFSLGTEAWAKTGSGMVDDPRRQLFWRPVGGGLLGMLSSGGG